MKIYGKVYVAVSLFCISLVFSPLNARTTNEFQNDIASGAYQPNRLIDRALLKNLPVPRSNTDYAFIQAIGKRVNIVIGSFSKDEKLISLISDLNSDGKVDLIVRYNTDKQRFIRVANVSEVVSDEQFLQMKKDIIAGVSKDGLRPNAEGEEFIDYLLKSGEGISKKDRGYVVTNINTTQAFNTIAKYFFSYSDPSGADLVFHVHFRIMNKVKVKPVIPQTVYCIGTRDKFLVEKTKSLITKTYKYYPKL